MSVNKAIIVGNLGRDPEVRTTQNGDKVCNFSVATSERWKDKNTGETKEKSEWHSIIIWNEHLISVAERFLKKGSKVYLEGQIATRKWQDQSGNDRYSTEIVLQRYRGELQMLDSKPNGSQPDRGSINDPAQQGPADNSGQSSSDDLDDEIPF